MPYDSAIFYSFNRAFIVFRQIFLHIASFLNLKSSQSGYGNVNIIFKGFYQYLNNGIQTISDFPLSQINSACGFSYQLLFIHRNDLGVFCIHLFEAVYA